MSISKAELVAVRDHHCFILEVTTPEDSVSPARRINRTVQDFVTLNRGVSRSTVDPNSLPDFPRAKIKKMAESQPESPQMLTKSMRLVNEWLAACSVAAADIAEAHSAGDEQA